MERKMLENIRWNNPSFVGSRVVLETSMFTLILSTLITSHQAGIIDSILHHKYRSLSGLAAGSNTSQLLPLDPINASSSSILEHFEGQDGRTTSVEYQSPIEKIMEIISGKPRSILVMDQQQKPLESETAHSSLPLPEMPTHQAAETDPLNFDQNWAIIGPAERYIPQSHASSVMPQASHTLEQVHQMQRPLVMGGHQQAYTSQHLNDLERQILERAASIQNRPREHHPILLGSYVPHHQHQQQQQQMGSLEAAIQSPVIIPSPLVHSQRPTMAPRVLLTPVTSTNTKAETQAETESEKESEEESPARDTGEDSSSDNEAGDDKATKETTNSEPLRVESSRKGHQETATGEKDDDTETSPEESKTGGSQVEREDNTEQENEEPISNQGSSSYHENFDSDTMDEPSSTSSGSPSSDGDSEVGESSNQVLTGLINVGLNDDCLQCICRASSGCDYLLRCITRGADEKYCGPFQITEDYWKLAGSPGDSPNNFSAFDECANEADCAVETVTNYMKRFHKDCDGDGNITCLDYARLHRLKPDECEQTEKLANNSYDAYWAKFQRCAEGYNRSRTRQEEEDM